MEEARLLSGGQARGRWKDHGMFLDLSSAELELVEHSVALRLQTWRWTEEYLKAGFSGGLIEECHQLSEAEWMVEQYEALLRKVMNSAAGHAE